MGHSQRYRDASPILLLDPQSDGFVAGNCAWGVLGPFPGAFSGWPPGQTRSRMILRSISRRTENGAMSLTFAESCNLQQASEVAVSGDGAIRVITRGSRTIQPTVRQPDGLRGHTARPENVLAFFVTGRKRLRTLLCGEPVLQPFWAAPVRPEYAAPFLSFSPSDSLNGARMPLSVIPGRSHARLPKAHDSYASSLPRISMRWALCTSRSRMPSASVGSPICSCHRETGSCEVRTVERTW